MKALLVIDMLKDFIDDEGTLSVGPVGKQIIPCINKKIHEFREKGYPIIFMCDNHEKDDKEFEMFAPHCIAGTHGCEIIDSIDFNQGDKIIKKRRYSSFFGTDLDLYLREKEIDEIYLTGVCTNICVLYTAASARNLGYKVGVFEDCVASFDEKAHCFALKEMKDTLGCEIL